MHRLARFALLLVVAAAPAGARRPAHGQLADPYATPPEVPADNAAAPLQQPANAWPANEANRAAPATTPGEPRLLPPGPGALAASGREVERNVRQAGGLHAAQTAAAVQPPSEPLPLSRHTDGSAPLGPDSLPPVVSTAASLGLVLGLFLLVVWSVRRGMPKGAGLLPSEAVEVLGRAPLVGRQQVHLVRCGNKLLLVTVTASGTQTLAEITDPAEVERLHALCQPTAPAGALRQWLGHFTHAAREKDYRDRPDTVDFRHLDVGSPRA